MILVGISHSGLVKTMEADAHPNRIPGDLGIQGSPRVPREPDDGEELTDHFRRRWPPSIRRQT